MSQALNRMRNSGRKVAEIAFFDVGDKALAIRIDAGDARPAVQHERPFRGSVPMQFADTAGGQPHVHAGKRLGHRKLADGDLARPPARLKALVREREWILEGLHPSGVRGQRLIGVRVRGVQGRIRRARIARAPIGLGCLCGLLPLSCDILCRQQAGRGQCCGAHSQKTSARYSVFLRFTGRIYRLSVRRHRRDDTRRKYTPRCVRVSSYAEPAIFGLGTRRRR